MHIPRITQAQAYKLITRASIDSAKNPGLRFGQCLWNLVGQDYPDLADKYCGTARDFYYTAFRMDVFDLFFTHYVEVQDEQSNS